MPSTMITRAARFGNVELTIDFEPADDEDFVNYPIRIFYESADAAARACWSLRAVLSTQTMRIAHEVYLADTCDLPLLLLVGGIQHIFEMLPAKDARSDVQAFFGLLPEDFNATIH
jgi:hypothetical protein